MKLDSLLEIVNQKLIRTYNRPLNDAELMLLRGIWQARTYKEIAAESSYSNRYFAQVVAPELFRRLENAIGQPITKKNCRKVLESSVLQEKQPTTSKVNKSKVPPVVFDSDLHPTPGYPNGSVPLDSPFYVERSGCEARVYKEIQQPGALIRIKAPKEMGKTSLLLRILDYSHHLGYRTVSLNLEQIDRAILSDLNRFLRWLCANVSYQLQLEAKLDRYWNEDMGSKVSCTFYFRGYLLSSINSPIVLVLDEVNQIFEHPEVAKDFLPLLRSWYEEAKKSTIWEKLRFVVAHCTEIYVPLHLNQSPFNVGLPVQLTDFTLKQIQQLAERYELNWKSGKRSQTADEYGWRTSGADSNSSLSPQSRSNNSKPTSPGGQYFDRYLSLSPAPSCCHFTRRTSISDRPRSSDELH